MSYTFSKLITDIPGSLEQLPGSTIQDAGNRRAERAIAPFDTPQNFWFSAIYELPFGARKRYSIRTGWRATSWATGPSPPC